LLTDWATKPQPVGESRWRFPLPSDLSDDDVVGVGGDLEPSTLVNAYRRGMFPMELSGSAGVLGWWSPDPRGIVPLDGLRVTRSMRQSARRFDVRVDTCFARVIRGCADPSRDDGWISDAFIDAYTKLHELGWAHSVEVFDRAGDLAGGLYGVRVAGLFAGESMFHRQRDASKVALMALVDLMRTSGMRLLDVQWCTDHLASLGAIAVSRQEYLARLADAVGVGTERDAPGQSSQARSTIG
jgi:leucyl/phenylalanyl-tRNA---protein transferase